MGGLATIVFLYRRRYTAVLAFWLTMAGIGLSVQYGKKFISRDRPMEVAFYPEHNFSFPSGHATTSMALYGMLHRGAPALGALAIGALALVGARLRARSVGQSEL